MVGWNVIHALMYEEGFIIEFFEKPKDMLEALIDATTNSRIDDLNWQETPYLATVDIYVLYRKVMLNLLQAKFSKATVVQGAAYISLRVKAYMAGGCSKDIAHTWLSKFPAVQFCRLSDDARTLGPLLIDRASAFLLLKVTQIVHTANIGFELCTGLNMMYSKLLVMPMLVIYAIVSLFEYLYCWNVDSSMTEHESAFLETEGVENLHKWGWYKLQIVANATVGVDYLNRLVLRGICNDTTRRALKDLIVQNRPQIVFLCETKSSSVSGFRDLHHALGFPHSKEVLSVGQSGGLGMFWNDEVNVQVRTFSAHHIDLEIGGGPGDPRWRLTGFYGYLTTAERDKSWKLLRDLRDLDSLPWVVIGDFNEILNNSEKLDGPPRAERQMRGFREALGYGDLLDLGFQGVMSTWWNSETRLRLDRAVCTPCWYDIFGCARVRHLPPSDSDHVPILLQASAVQLPQQSSRHRFKFEAFWLQHGECDGVVKSAWATDVVGSPMYSVVKKIEHTRLRLNVWQRQTFKARQQEMLGIRERLEELLGVPFTMGAQHEKKDLMGRLQSLLSQEELFWRQRSKVSWLKEGDRNTSYFHRKAANRRRKNSIPGLYDEQGQWCDDDDGMEKVVTNYFTKMFTASNIDLEAVETTLAAIQPCVTHGMNEKLCASYSQEEVKNALFQMYPTKSPGPDGMPPIFFQHYWETIGADVTEAVQDFLHSGQLLPQINFTHICLIPKVNNPEHMSDLRPIALCNVIYKICSKVIANRLKQVLPSLIFPYQSAFVPGRLITDNILVANEIAHFVHNKREGGEGFMAWKLDLSKAYDRIEWTFLRKVLDRFGFNHGWIEMVMQCISSVRYSFLVRGKPRGLVIPSRGLRQGDPLSPYLFLLGVEGFSALLRQKQEMGFLPGIEVFHDAPAVNHLLFADDSMLYAHASLEDCYQIQDVIETYGRASGQLVNFDKSSVVFSKNVSDFMQDEVSSLLGVEVVESHERYLGLPTYVGRKKTATFQFIKDNLAKKLSCWQGKMLSGAGKDILIRGSTNDKRKIHWKTWNALCNPKEEGGLGFRSLSNFNSAMLVKQVWRVISNPNSLFARLYKAKYYPTESFWTAELHTSPSYSWKSIFSTRELLQESVYWQIGNGTQVNIWSDSWVPSLPSGQPDVNATALEEVAGVQDLISNTGSWNVELINRLFSVEEAEAILSIPLSSRNVEDRLVWKLERDGKYSVKTAYRFSFSHSNSRSPFELFVGVDFWKKLWKVVMPSSAKIHIWRVCHNILPSKDRLLSRRVPLETQVCVLCESATETSLHICRDCPFTKQVLQGNGVLVHTCFSPQALNCDLLGWLSICVQALSLKDLGDLLFLLWSVWKERNSRVWDDKKGQPWDVLLKATTRLQDFRVHNTRPTLRETSSSRLARWRAPSVGIYKINVDGSFDHVSRKGSAGFVVRDCNGTMIAGGGKPLCGLLSTEHAEALACKLAFDFVLDQVLVPAIVETDSQLVQQQLCRSEGSNFSQLGRIYDDLGSTLRAHSNLNVVYTRRGANKAAHLMAASASSFSRECFYFSPPPFLLAVIAAEQDHM
ncbi:uncharacterized protein LOC133744858 [Rosa rugosa]|uniref:uncharacterized protein LOC133744858 n=1 Tax=Rosa rugosa TaxID=74645 RepID=UPI002B4030DC|nr:uncharacterized protein LOC133744858 [Rosa rugosa]